MTKPANYLPEGYSAVMPYLVLNGAAAAIDFYRKVFSAVEIMRISQPGSDMIGHAEIRIGNSVIMLADEHPGMIFRGPKSLGGVSITLVIYVPDCDAVMQRALAAGAKELRPVQDQFYGARSGTIEDPFGHVWTISTHKEDVSPEEMARRAAELG